jgi:alpha-L-fucosidase
VPYDGADPQYQDLYHPAAAPGDTAWYSTNPAWHREWFDRIKDLVDRYHPDLLYTDGGLPFGETGRSLVAHFYNANLARHGGRLEAVYTCKSMGSGEFVQGACVQDMERGVLSSVNPLPWQTDTSIGDWFYNRDWKFRPVSWVIHMLADIVSKNGNLLLNVVQRPDGSLDAEVERMLGELAAWTSTNGEAIYGTRPWIVHGEGPVRAGGEHFKEDFAYTSQDVRFTTKGDALYAIVMGWPEKSVTVAALGTSSPYVKGRVREVTLLGHQGKIAWTQNERGLTITVPDRRPGEHAFAFRVLGVIR